MLNIYCYDFGKKKRKKEEGAKDGLRKERIKFERDAIV